jgi:cytochrome c
LTTPSALADDAQALATKNQCMTCHKLEGKLVGPAYKDVAAKYKGDPEALDKLTAKVRNGGKGVWGQIPMPPNKTISDDDLETVVNWILSQGLTASRTGGAGRPVEAHRPGRPAALTIRRLHQPLNIFLG